MGKDSSFVKYNYTASVVDSIGGSVGREETTGVGYNPETLRKIHELVDESMMMRVIS